jgi:hypothetical protein
MLEDIVSVFPNLVRCCLQACHIYHALCFIRVFNHERRLNFAKGFLCIYWDIICGFSLSFCWYAVLNLMVFMCWTIPTSLEWNNLIMVYDLLELLNSVCIYIHWRDWPIIFLFFVSLSGLGMSVILAYWMVVAVLLPFLFHGKDWQVLILFNSVDISLLFSLQMFEYFWLFLLLLSSSFIASYINCIFIALYINCIQNFIGVWDSALGHLRSFCVFNICIHGYKLLP